MCGTTRYWKYVGIKYHITELLSYLSSELDIVLLYMYISFILFTFLLMVIELDFLNLTKYFYRFNMAGTVERAGLS